MAHRLAQESRVTKPAATSGSGYSTETRWSTADPQLAMGHTSGRREMNR